MTTKSKASSRFASSVKTVESKPDGAWMASVSSKEGVIWPAALSGLEERQARALAALEQSHAERLGRLEERLTAAERATADLSGQLQELR